MRALRSFSVLAAIGLLAVSATPALADAIQGGERQGLNLAAIAMFLVFVGGTLGITYWAAQRTRSAADFYAAGVGITGFQNGLAPATTCRPLPSSASPGSSSPAASTG